MMLRAVVPDRLDRVAQPTDNGGSEEAVKDASPTKPVVPLLNISGGGRVHEIQTFAHYVATQIGFEDLNECPHLCTLSYDYLKKTEGYEQNLLAFFHNKMNPDALLVQLIEELDKCILGYFSFHWKFATHIITQVLTHEQPRRKLRRMVMEATRKMRFERVTRDLKVTRLFTTLVEELKVIGIHCQHDRCRAGTDVMVPAAHSDRSPVLLLMGGGMGAGKSTVLKQIMKEVFWTGAAANAVVVEADAFKESDVIYQAISSRGHHTDMLQTAELVHQSSTDAAASLLVTALNEGRDVIMDGTLSWEPFVRQTIAMARSVHRQRYRMGVGYRVAPDGTTTEKYWEPVEEEEDGEQQGQAGGPSRTRKPYRIELVGIICDAYLAVVRGIRRAIISGRAVRVHSQLKSHKRFAGAFRKYCDLVDNARLYSTNTIAGAKLIGWKDKDSRLLVDVEEIGLLDRVSRINEEANCVHELYPDGHPTGGAGSVWDDLMASPVRASIQRELKEAIFDSEACFPSP
ncbi:calmodulin calcium-dependent NAD kinase-like [Miscanthus floridulus]|uniref:calmodulin calcium-dependent NAD kinase-like n=1 Tax=Miscanthus floridulus TaxID=154761 RepID=UPI00345A9B86